MILVFSSACIQQKLAPLDAENGDLVVLAAVEPSGRINEVDHYLPPAEAPVLSRGKEELVLAWVIKRAELVGPDGAMIDDAMIAGLRLSTESAVRELGDTGRCARCMFDTAVAPQIVNRGDRCFLPGFAEPQTIAGDGAPTFDLETVRKNIFLEWPGDCACTPYQLSADYRFEARLVELSEQIEPIEDVAQAPNGDVTVVSQQILEVLAPDGTPRIRKTRAQLPFTGPIQSAVATPDGDILIAGHDETAGDAESKLRRFSPTLEVREELNLAVRPGTMRWLADRAILLGTTEARDSPTAMACVLPGSNLGGCGASSALRCEIYTPRSFTVIGSGIREAAIVGGMLATLGNKGVALFERPLDPTMNISVDDATTKTQGAVADCGGSVRWTVFGANVFDVDDQHEVTRMAALGDHLLFCISGTRARIAGMRVDRSIFADGAPAPAIVEQVVDGTGCGSFSAVPECPGALRGIVGGKRPVFSLDPQGDLVTRTDCEATRDSPSPETSTLVPGWTLSRTYGGRLFIRDDRAPAPEFSLIHGTERQESVVAAVIAHEDRFVAFQQTGEVSVIELSADRRDFVRARVLPALVPGREPPERISAVAVLDPTTQEYLAAIYGGPAARFLRVKIENDQPVSEVFALNDPPPLAGLVFRRISIVSPGIFVLPTSDGRIFVLRGDQLSEALLDPAGPIPTRDAFECYESTVPTPNFSADVLRDSHGVFGTAWVVGCEGTIYRVHPYSDPPRALGISLKGMNAYDETRDGPPSFTSVRAECPDSVLFAARGTGRTDWEQGRLFELHPGLKVNLEPINRGVRAGSLISSELPTAIAGTSRWVTMSFAGDGNGSMHVVGDLRRFWLQDPIGRADAHPSGAVVSGTHAGRLIFGTVSPR